MGSFFRYYLKKRISRGSRSDEDDPLPLFVRPYPLRHLYVRFRHFQGEADVDSLAKCASHMQLLGNCKAFQREQNVCMIYAATKKVRNKVTVDAFSAEDHRELLNSLRRVYSIPKR